MGICCSNKNQFVHAVQIPEHDSRFATQNGFKGKSNQEFVLNSALNDFHWSSQHFQISDEPSESRDLNSNPLKTLSGRHFRAGPRLCPGLFMTLGSY